MTKPLNEATLEVLLSAIDALCEGRGEVVAFKPTKIIIQPSMMKMARRVLRAPLFANNRRATYLRIRGARK